MKNNGIMIIDFGSQYTKLIARRVREQKIYSEILHHNTSAVEINNLNPAAIILSGGPSSVFDSSALEIDPKILSLPIPILGICYGLQLLAHNYGGLVETKENGEYGLSKLSVDNTNKIFLKIPKNINVWMSHMDQVTQVPEGWKVIAKSSNDVIAAISNKDNSRIATQFHPEVDHTDFGTEILKNFLLKIAKCNTEWTPKNFVSDQVKKIKNEVGNDKLIIGVSGGVDSTVAAALIHKAIGKQSIGVLIDHGLMRLGESKKCVRSLKEGLGVNIHSFDESSIFFSKLENVKDPEKKRKIIGNQFIESFERISKDFGDVKYLAQGTLYPDVIESGVTSGHSSHTIKSHHNVGGLPDQMSFSLIEPLRELFKDEVRNVGVELGLPKELVFRHPFPGPGLAVRIIGEINKERVKILQQADKIFIDALYEDDLYDKIWQAFAVLIPVKTVGVMGDQRTYENLISLRAVTSSDGMTADWFRFPQDTLAKVSNRIVNNVKGVNRVVYDITSKPPGTIEWE
ncbi:MAG: glutamine-hydrolyzing GMP synthase [Candidatus Marinimicrobia bacterium]|nr:glutamine-hydrolyzing GMP synthase [Candidatus Neomarinimicrobiota bacterium]